jgi:hypothetical protein
MYLSIIYKWRLETFLNININACAVKHFTYLKFTETLQCTYEQT